MVSVYCGIGTTIAKSVQPQGYPLQYLIALGILIVLALVLKGVVPSGAWHINAAAGGVCGLLFFVVAGLGLDFYPRRYIDPFICVLVFSIGTGMGWGAFLFVEANCRFVNWMDRKIGGCTRSTKRTRDSCSISGRIPRKSTTTRQSIQTSSNKW